MKLHLIFIYIILLVAPAVSLAQTVVEFPAKTIDIGNVAEDTDSVNCVFEVVNKGDIPLIILGVHVNCGCVKATTARSPSSRERAVL